MITSIQLKSKRKGSVLRRHPWIFSGAVEQIDGNPFPGDTVEIRASDGTWLARGAYSPESQIVCRILTWNPEELIDREFFRRRLAAAYAYREGLGLSDVTNGYRLVFGESDGLPGLVVDRYGSIAVGQFLTVGMDRWKVVISELLLGLPGIDSVYERSDTSARAREGLPEANGLLAGDEIEPMFLLQEYGMKLWVDIAGGQKTGAYLDQRENRRLEGIDVVGKSVLDCFCYGGGFGIRAWMRGAASVTQVDSSEDALDLARRNALANDLESAQITYEKADVFQFLRSCRDARRTYDIIVLDPPKLAENQGQVEKACRGYKDLNLLALKLLNPGGRLLTFSCSGAVTPELFRKVVGDAARDAGKTPRIAKVLQQAPDHPLSLDIPEADYLTGLDLSL